MKTFIASILFLTLSQSTFAQHDEHSCPVLTGTYCCGVSLGDIQACRNPKYIEQEAIEGGQKYSKYDSDHHLTSEWIADGKSRHVEDSFLIGTETITCENGAVFSNVRDAVLTQRREAKGYYWSSMSLKPDGRLGQGVSCIFTAPDGHQVYNCGLQTGYACYKKPGSMEIR